MRPPVSQRALPSHDAQPSRITTQSPPVSQGAPCNGHISHYKPITLSARYMTGIPVGYHDPVGILATRFRSGHIDLQIRSGSDYLGLLDIPVRSRPERILEVIRSGPGFSGPESDRNRIYSGTLPSLFHVHEVAFLGFIVSSEGIRMDPSKVAAIAEWPVPKSVHDIRVFLGLANFYRRFIKDFSKVSAPITALLKKNKKFQWGTAAQQAFDQLRNAFTSDPILHHFDPKLATVLEADASDYALGAVISQRDPETGLLHPITFYSCKFNSAELNYEIYDKEMLAIVESMDRYRHYFEGLGHKTTVLSDHRNLSWFTETKMYNRRQARWAEKLARFDFVITFRPGKQSGKPDALSRRPDYTLGDNKEARTITFLKPEQFDTHSFELNSAVVESLGTNEERAEAIRNALPADPQIGPHLNYLQDPSITRPDDVAEYLRPFSIDREGLVLRNGLIYVPEVDSLKLAILRECHDAKTAGHLGQAKTLDRKSV